MTAHYTAGSTSVFHDEIRLAIQNHQDFLLIVAMRSMRLPVGIEHGGVRRHGLDARGRASKERMRLPADCGILVERQR
jgi:hypothetical protein